MIVVNIFDIDGCILPNVFSNFNESDNYNLDKTTARRIYNQSITNRLMKTKLYPNFIRYYRDSCENKPNMLNVFITGRKFSEFEKITISQLAFLDYHELYFYPECLAHEKVEYNIWKFGMIENVINTYKIYNPTFFIFDDNEGYFRILINKYKEMNLYCILVNSNKSWSEIHK